VDDDTNLVFCTTGVLLRKLQRGLDPSITHVLVDEVHERSVETDFLLAILRRLLPQRPALRVVLMSATMEADRFAAYLGPRAVMGGGVASASLPKQCPVLEVPGFVHPVREIYLDEIVDVMGVTVKGQHRPRDVTGAPLPPTTVAVKAKPGSGAGATDVAVSGLVDPHSWFKTIGQLDTAMVATAVRMVATERGPRPPPPSRSDRGAHPP